MYRNFTFNVVGCIARASWPDNIQVLWIGNMQSYPCIRLHADEGESVHRLHKVLLYYILHASKLTAATVTDSPVV